MKSCKAISLAIFGTFLEYYDYALYGYSAIFIAKTFFPELNNTSALLHTYGVFIAGSCSKPLGAFIFGALSDRFGRGFSLKISMIGIALPTLIIGLLPGADSIGDYALFFLLCCRLFQGLFVSGESDVVRVYLFESIDKKYRCFTSSLIYFTCMVGIYFASLMSEISGQSENPEAWRWPFILGGCLCVFIFFLRQSLVETSVFCVRNHGPDKKVLFSKSRMNTLMNLIRELAPYKKEILITLLITGSIGGQYHFYFIFLGQYLNDVLNVSSLNPHNTSFLPFQGINSSTLVLVFTLALPLGGLLADYFGVKRFLMLSFVFLLFMTGLNIIALSSFFFPSHFLLPTLNLPLVFILTTLALSLVHSCIFTILFEQFGVFQRCKGISIGHALGSMILSGTTPMLSLYLFKMTQFSLAPIFYFSLLCIISFLAFLWLNQRTIMNEWTYSEPADLILNAQD